MGAEVSAMTHHPIIPNPSITLSLRVMTGAEISAITDLLSDHSQSTHCIMTMGVEISAISHHSDHFQSTHYIISTCNVESRKQYRNQSLGSFIPCPSITLSLCVMMRAKISAITDL